MTQSLRANSLAGDLSRAVPLILAIAFLVVPPTRLHAQQSEQREQLLVSVQWLAQHLNDPNLVLLHVGDADDYKAEHIPGAHLTSHRELADPNSSGPDALTLELPDPAELQAKLRGYGISEDSRIVVYWGSEWVSPTTRVVYTLAWAGLADQTVLLDGGIGAWKAAGHAVTGAPTPGAQGDITVAPQDDLVVDAAWVQANANNPGYKLVDGRNAEFFNGERQDRDVTGHIPGAGNVMWQELLDDSLRLKDPATLRQAFAAAGVEPQDTVVAYCHIGQYATMVIFMARTLGHEVKLYDGSFQDWARKGLPVQKPKD
jgi:thiosulfate/3-mercaptopyruvate sulfurtransferase